MKQDGTANIFKPSDIRHYPLFYIELIYAVASIFGGIVVLTTTVNVNVPGTSSAIWHLAGSDAGLFILGIVFVLLGVGGIWALLKGGFKWRARVMFFQFLFRLYVTIGIISVFGIFPTGTWLNIFVLALVSAVIYLAVGGEAKRRGH
jgi:hypothetical protein